MQVEIRFQPFELNPQMGPEGEDMTEHLTRKYGSTPEQQALAALLRTRQVSSQALVLEHLRAQGFHATQATISRDLDDLVIETDERSTRSVAEEVADHFGLLPRVPTT